MRSCERASDDPLGEVCLCLWGWGGPLLMSSPCRDKQEVMSEQSLPALAEEKSFAVMPLHQVLTLLASSLSPLI